MAKPVRVEVNCPDHGESVDFVDGVLVVMFSHDRVYISGHRVGDGRERKAVKLLCDALIGANLATRENLKEWLEWAEAPEHP